MIDAIYIYWFEPREPVAGQGCGHYGHHRAGHAHPIGAWAASWRLRRLRAAGTSIGGWRIMNKRWIAVMTLSLSLLCSCSSSGGAEAGKQASGPGASIPAKVVSEQIKEISTSQLKDWMTTGHAFTLIDVREDNEWEAGHAATAIHISRGALSGKIAAAVPDKSSCIVLYCLGGVRSAAAAQTLQEMGYTNVFSLAGGFKNYLRAGLPAQK
jgi:rhodanese-related sulfurtransferase